MYRKTLRGATWTPVRSNRRVIDSVRSQPLEMAWAGYFFKESSHDFWILASPFTNRDGLQMQVHHLSTAERCNRLGSAVRQRVFDSRSEEEESAVSPRLPANVLQR